MSRPYTLPTDRKPKKVWDPELDPKLLQLRDREGFTFREIAAIIGYSHGSVIRHYRLLKGHTTTLNRPMHGANKRPQPEPKKPARRVLGHHLKEYKRARRGAHIPAEFEDYYISLLVAGVSVEEACRRVSQP